MFNLILNLVGFDNSFSEEKKSVSNIDDIFERFLAGTNATKFHLKLLSVFFNDAIKQTFLQFHCTFPEKPQISW